MTNLSTGLRLSCLMLYKNEEGRASMAYPSKYLLMLNLSSFISLIAHTKSVHFFPEITAYPQKGESVQALKMPLMVTSP